MAVSQVDLVNNALTLLGADLITSIDDPVKAAILSKQKLPSVRDGVLREFTWNCATAQVSLAPLATGPAFGYAKSFQIPSDCLRIVSLENSPSYIVIGRTIQCDSTEVKLTYIQRIVDVSQFDALLAMAIEARLAADLAYPLLQSGTVRDAMFQMYDLTLKKAKGIDSREKSMQELDVDVWIASRYDNQSNVNRSNR